MQRCACGMKRVVLVVALGGAVALLLWLKLRMVTQVPRTAYADPKAATKQVEAK